MGTEKQDEQRLSQAISNPDVPKLYFNGFTVAIGSGDIVLMLQRNGEPLAVLNASYTVAKTLGAKLGGSIAVLESSTGNNIMTVDDIVAKTGQNSEIPIKE